MHDFKPGWNTYIERRGYGLEADLAFDDVSVADYPAVLLLGGRAPEYLRNSPRMQEIVREFDRAEKWVFAICHGVQILAAAGLTRGKRVTCYEHVRLEAEQAGGIFVGEQTVRDGRILTAQTWQSDPSFYREIVGILSGNANAALPAPQVAAGKRCARNPRAQSSRRSRHTLRPNAGQSHSATSAQIVF
jgi:protease I